MCPASYGLFFFAGIPAYIPLRTWGFDFKCIHMDTHYLYLGVCVLKLDPGALALMGQGRGAVISSIRREAELGCEASPTSLNQTTKVKWISCPGDLEGVDQPDGRW